MGNGYWKERNLEQRASRLLEKAGKKQSPAKKKKKRSKSKSAAFYRSREWRELRYEALKNYGAKCNCCGATPEDGAVMNVDHIKPRRKYPELALDLDNLQVLCGACNHGKGNRDDTDWRKQYEEPDLGVLMGERIH